MKDLKTQKTDNDSKHRDRFENDYLLNEGTQILSDYAIFNESIYLSKAA